MQAAIFDPQVFTVMGWFITAILAIIGGLIIAAISGAKRHNEDVKEKLQKIDTTLQLQNQKYDNVLEKVTSTGEQLNKIFTIVNRHGRAIVHIETLLQIKNESNGKDEY